MSYWEELAAKAFWDTWDLVINRPLPTAMIGGAILLAPLVILLLRKKHTDFVARLKEVGVLSLIYAGIFISIFLVHLFVFTPKALVDQARLDRNSEQEKKENAEKERDNARKELHAVSPTEEIAKLQSSVQTIGKKLEVANETIGKLTPIKRSLTRDQHEKLVAALKDGNSYKIAIRRDTPGTQDYSDQFESVFKEAGWTIVAPMTLDTTMNELVDLVHLRAEKGIHLLVHNGKHPPQQADKLSKAMMLAGIPVTNDEISSISEDTVELFIGFPEEAMPPSPTPNMEVSPP